MEIKTRFTLLFAFVVGVILFFFSYAIYYFSQDYRQKDFELRLRDRAVEVLESVKSETAPAQRNEEDNPHALIGERFAIHATDGRLLFGEAIPLPAAMGLARVHEQSPYTWAEKDRREGIAFLHTYDGVEHVIISTAYDRHGWNYIDNLKRILIVRLIILMLIIFISGYVFVSFFLKPISDMVKQVDRITHSNLSHRLTAAHPHDEIGQLTATFNRMLDRLESAFNVQKRFVSNASHELRNPLTAIGGKIDVALIKDRGTEEYKETLKAISVHIRSLSALTNNLLELANSDVETLFQNLEEVRVDEVLWTCRENLLKQNPDYRVDIRFEGISDDGADLLCKGKSKLLETAFINMAENACKYSEDRTVRIRVTADKRNIILFFTDHGIGMPEEYLKHLFEPFHRGRNVHGVSGKGIGLALVKGIIKLHSGKIFVQSKVNRGTTIEIALPKMA